MTGTVVKGLFLSIEKWASESDERAKLLVVLTCVAIGFLVLIVIGAIAVVTLPPQAWSF